MKMKKSLLSVLLSMLFMFSSFVPSINCYAVSISDINTYFDVQGKFYQILNRVTDISTTQEHQTNILNRMYDILEDGGYSGSRSGQGLESSGDVTINTNGDVLLSVDLQNALRESVQTEIDNSGYKYVYSFSGADWLDFFDNQDAYHSFLTVLESNSDYLCYVSTENYNSRPPQYIAVLDNGFEWLYDSYNVGAGTPYYQCDWFDNWETTTFTDSIIKNYQYDSSSGTYVEVNNSNRSGTGLPWFRAYNVSQGLYPSGANSRIITSLNRTQVIMYMTYNDMRLGSEGLQSYYVGNDFSTSEVNTTQTLTDSMLNSSISYSDISNYVNSYYVNNQSYPTTENVYNYINNYNGSGGDNGNGSNDDNNIWDFLDGIGEFIGNLIRSLGNVLSGILSLLTDVIDMFIGENGLPNIVGQLIQYFLPFLPIEIVQLIEFSLLLAIILGVIRLIRGH